MKPKEERILDILKNLWALQHKGCNDGFNFPTHVTPEGWHYRADTQCYVETLQYNFSTKQGLLRMGDDSCTDMMGCIRLFQAIDPEVKTILTHQSGGELDTCYVRNGGFDDWKAYFPDEFAKQFL